MRTFLICYIACIGWLKSNGQTSQLDAIFGSSGKNILTIGTSDDIARCMAILPNGKFLVAGDAGNGSDKDWVIVRYDSVGHVDSSFGINGKVVFPNGVCTAIKVQPDSKIVMAGDLNLTAELDVIRILENGDLDTTFGTGGMVEVFSYLNDIFNLDLQSDGKIVLGTFPIRLNADGSVDSTFNKAFIPGLPTGSIVVPYYYGVTVQADGKILSSFANMILSTWGGSSAYLFKYLARYNADGSLDLSFNGTGCKEVSVVGLPVVQSDGSILICGTKNTIGPMYEPNALERVDADGTDPVVLMVQPYQHYYTKPSVCFQADGKVIFTSYTLNLDGNWDVLLTRLNVNGSLDYSFGNDGTAQVSTDFLGNEYTSACVVQPDGKIVVAGYTNVLGNYDFLLLRYNHTILNTSEFEEANALSLFPNPVEDVLTIRCESCKGIGRMELVDSKGQILLIKDAIDLSKIEIDMTGLPHGVYCVNWTNNEVFMSGKIIK